MRWLEKEARGGQVIVYVFGSVLLSYVYVVCMLGPGYFSVERFTRANKEDLYASMALFPLVIFFAALLEELMFRAPLLLAVGRGWATGEVLVLAGLISVLFGFVHGSIMNILIQGVLGFLYSLVFLKCGGLQGGRWKPLLASTSTHFLWNASVIGLILVRG